MQAIISTNGLRFLDLIQYPTIEIPFGKTTFVCGPSGSGKTTFLRFLNAVESPNAGSILFEGQNIAEINTIALRRQILLVGQTVYLFDATIKENFEKFYAYRELPPPNEESIKQYLHLCCANFSLDTSCTPMSGGERQRVYTALFLSFMPKVLMLDEPTSALDTSMATALLQNIKDFCTEHNITLVVVSHSETLAKQFADQTITLKGGVM